MKRVGLTGSIASGKSEVAKVAAALGIPVFDADQAVHDLYEDGTAAGALPPAFEAAVHGSTVHRGDLSKILRARPDLFPALESVIHPLVRQREEAFFHRALMENNSLALADVPLLMEGHREKNYDLVILVHATEALRRARALQRPGMTEEKFNQIMARQMGDAEKLEKADIVIDNTGTLGDLRRQAKTIFKGLLESGGGA